MTERQTGENLSVQAGELLVNYDDFGPVYATPVVFIHGTPFHKGIWELQAETLKSNYRVICYDLRGHGRTSGSSPEVDFTVDLLTDDLINFLDALGLKKVILCGISLGGQIALNAVDRHPERIQALVLAGCQCGTDSHEVHNVRDSHLALLEKKDMEVFADEVMKHWFAPNSFVTRKEEVRAVRKMVLETDAGFAAKSIIALLNRQSICGNLWAVSCPVLILVGKEDEITPPETAAFMRENITASEMHQIEYAGHLANMENTHEFNILLRNFVDRVSGKKQPGRPGREEKELFISRDR